MHPKTLFIAVLLTLAVTDVGQAVDLSGRWKGTWSTYSSPTKRPHHGSLRVRLTPRDDGSYQGLFAGRFAVVVPYVYRAKVYQHGNTLVATRRLGPMGEYRMQLHYSNGAMDGSWTAAGESGPIRLTPGASMRGN